MADPRNDEQSSLREPRNHGLRAGGRRPQVEAAAHGEQGHVREGPGGERGAAGRARPAKAEVGVAELRSPRPERAQRAGRESRERGLLEREARRGGRVGRPREGAVAADGRGVERRAEVDRRLLVAAVVQVGEPCKRLRAAPERASDDGRQLGGEARVEVGVDHHREELEAVDADLLLRAVRLADRDSKRLRREAVRERRHVAGEVGGRGAAASVRAERRERRRHGAQNVRAERVRQLRRQNGVEEQALDVVRMRERVRQRELRAVGDAVESDLVVAERLADRVEVLCVIGRRVEVALRAEGCGACGRRCALGVRRVRELERRAVEQSRRAGAAVVVGDERVPGEEVAVERDVRRRPEIEHVRRALAGTAREEEHDAAADSRVRHHLDVEGHRPRHDAAPVERHDDLRADHGCVRPARRLRARRNAGEAVEASTRVEPREQRRRDARRPRNRIGRR